MISNLNQDTKENKENDEKHVDYYSNDIDWNILKERYEPIIKTIYAKAKKQKIPKNKAQDMVKNDDSNNAEESKQANKDEEEEILIDSTAVNHWNKFYDNNQDRFFKDRKYLEVIFKEIAEKSRVDEISKYYLLECGCGTGNTIYPVIRFTPQNLHVHAFDISQTAIDIVLKHELYKTGRVQGYVCDIIKENLTKIDDVKYSFCTMIFFLSAIPPNEMGQVLKKIDELILPGGMIFFRDYGLYDLAMIRNHKKGNMISESFYEKGDGTYAYYFSKEKLIESFENLNYITLQCEYCTISRENKKRQLRLDRVFVTGKFMKPLL